MRVRLERGDVHIDRQRVVILDRVTGNAGLDVDVLAAEPEHQRGASRRSVGEEETHAGLNDF